jgi:ribosomal protein S18 acetylase RimI-like enzyme
MVLPGACLECRRMGPELEQPLAEFFAAVLAAGDDRFFHPHPFTPEEAARLARYDGGDLYYVLLADRQILGYGMLRGWDEGYETPSLGIIIHPAARGRGLARLLMLFLHAAAQTRGARRIRLKVYPHNQPARSLYQSLGYCFEQEEKGQLVGVLELP